MKKISYIVFINIILSTLIFSYFFEFEVFFNFLEEYVKTYDVIIEDAKGSIDLYYLNKNNKLKKLKSYPIELLVVYDIHSHHDNIILLKELIKEQFKHCKINMQPKECNMWVPSHKDLKSDFLIGETLGGSYKNINFKFMFFIQHADGYDLDTLDKSWPVLNRVIKKNFSKNDLIIKLNLNIHSLKIRTGIITDMTKDANILINHYNDNYRWKPSLFLAYDRRSKYQLIAIDLPMNNYYIDIFFRYNKNKININNIDIDYLKRLYRIEQVVFMKDWYIKYNKYYN